MAYLEVCHGVHIFQYRAVGTISSIQTQYVIVGPSTIYILLNFNKILWNIILLYSSTSNKLNLTILKKNCVGQY